MAFSDKQPAGAPGGGEPWQGQGKSHSRQDKVRKALLREIGDILNTEIKDPRLDHQVISVTDVVLSQDMSHAKVYLSILADEDRRAELMTLLLEHTPKIRKAVGHRVRLRHTPQLHLLLDDSLERGTRMTQLLEQIARGEL